MITQQQLNIIANCVESDSDGGARSGKTELAMRLFPEDKARIQEALVQHPINQRWDEYVKASPEEQKTFLLPEDAPQPKLNRSTLLRRDDAFVHEVLTLRDKMDMIASGEMERGRRESQYDSKPGKRPMKMADVKAVAALAVKRINTAINEFHDSQPKPWEWDEFQNKYD